MRTVPGGSGLRIALLSPCYRPEAHRGTERMIRELSTGLIARGHKPTVITSHRSGPTRTLEDGLRVIRHWRPPDGRLVERRFFEDHLTHVPFSYLSLSRGRYDVAQAMFPTDALAAARWARRTGRPAILHYHGIPDHSELMERRLRLAVTVKAVEGCSAVVVSSRTAADAFERWLGVEARVIHPGIDLSAFAPAPERANAPTVFCAAAPDDPRKRVPLLVAAHALVRRKRPDARLELQRPWDPELAARLEAVEGVRLIEPVARPAELASAYQRAWVSVLPSLGDSFGISLVEALACGVPVVAANHGALAEVVGRDGIGGLFDADDESALARSLLEALELSEDPSTAARCREHAELFSNDRSTVAFERLYAELLGTSG